VENKIMKCSSNNDCTDAAADDEIKTADLKKAVSVLKDEAAPDHHKEKAASMLATTAQEAKKAEAFTPKKPDVVLKNDSGAKKSN
jgi:hypothetical protein